jgi:hypothetical protein
MLQTKFNNLVTAHINSLDPTIIFSAALLDDDNVTVATSNCSNGLHRCPPPPLPSILAQSIALMARSIFGQPPHKYLNTIMIAATHAIANTGAMSIFIMDGVDVVNKRVSPEPLTINMPDGRKVKSMYICDITIPGLPTILTGHIVLHLAIALLIGIRPLCNAGCTVAFDKDKCNVVFNGKVILRGFKDLTTDLWMLPINGQDSQTTLPRSAPTCDCPMHDDALQLHPGVNLATFTHSVKTRANSIKFAHQLLCNLKI